MDSVEIMINNAYRALERGLITEEECDQAIEDAMRFAEEGE